MFAINREDLISAYIKKDNLNPRELAAEKLFLESLEYIDMEAGKDVDYIVIKPYNKRRKHKMKFKFIEKKYGSAGGHVMCGSYKYLDGNKLFYIMVGEETFEVRFYDSIWSDDEDDWEREEEPLVSGEHENGKAILDTSDHLILYYTPAIRDAVKRYYKEN